MISVLYLIIAILTLFWLCDYLWKKRWKDVRQTEKLMERLASNELTLNIDALPQQRGIIICVDSDTVLQAKLLIITLRRLGCSLPIAIFSTKEIGEMLQQQGVFLIETGLPVKRVEAIVKAPFKEVILVEPNVLFLSNPALLFDSREYAETGALFWKDRPDAPYISAKKTCDWVSKFIPYRKGDNGILNKTNMSFQSRQLAVINKMTHKSGLENLRILNEFDGLTGSYLDEKEWLWFAFEVAHENYSFVGVYPGVVGEKHFNTLCGGTLQTDPAGTFLFTDSILNGDTVANPTFFAFGTEWNRSNCLLRVIPKDISPELKAYFNECARIAQQIKNENP